MLEPLERVRAEILARIGLLEEETVILEDGGGRTLARDIVSPESMPPFDNTAMDGFALRAADVAAASPADPVTLRVRHIVEAGAGELPDVPRGEAVRIYTGAPIPPTADAIVPFENALAYDDATVTLAAPIVGGAQIRRRGEDFRAGEVVLREGTRLSPASVGLLATIGIDRVEVRRRPRVAIHSSGNELIAVEERLTPGKIRNSNAYSIGARLQEWGAVPLRRPILRDSVPAVRAGLLETLALEPDAIITTGGISAGDLDLIREVARELGDDVRVRKVNMKPGKPLVDGLLRGVPFFGLPGNPAACLVSFEIFVRPALARMEGRSDGTAPRRRARITATKVLRSGGRLQLLRGSVRYDAHAREYLLEPTGAQGSHLLHTFATANCLVVVSPDTTNLAAGEFVDVLLLGDVPDAESGG